MKTRFTFFVPLLIFVLTLFSLSLSAEGSQQDDPCCSIPHDTEIWCSDLPWNFNPNNTYQLASLFGSPGGGWGCPSYYWTELEPEVNLNSCDVGTIIRNFQGTSGGWGGGTYYCQQVIWVLGTHDYQIKFPMDAMGICELPDIDGVEYDEEGCDLLAVGSSDMVFNTGSSACYKIFRTYTVVNWCEYDGISPAMVISRDEDCDGLPGDEDVILNRKPNGTLYIDRDYNPFNYNPGAGEINPSCGHDGNIGYWRSVSVGHSNTYFSNRGYYKYVQHIKVKDNIKPLITYTAPDPFCSHSNNQLVGCPGAVDIPFSVTEECSDQVEVKVFFFAFNEPVPLIPDNNIAGSVLSGSYPNYLIQGSYPLGQHSFDIHVKDGCGNSNSIAIPFEVVDCHAPSPVCIVSLSSAYSPLPPNTDADGDGDIDLGSKAIWASDFVTSGLGDCSGPVNLSINIQGETPDMSQTGLVLTCDDGDLVVVEVYAWDSADNPYSVQPDGSVGGPNYDYCLTFISFHNVDELCETVPPEPVNVSGYVHTLSDTTMADAEIWLRGGMDTMMLTTEAGTYEFLDLPGGEDYQLRPVRDGDDGNGVTTQDLIKLLRHILHIDTLDSPYLLIAADIDSSGVVDQEDYNQLRRLVTHQDTSFMHNTSWRFVPMDYEFSDAENPFVDTIPDYISLEAVAEDMDSLAFMAIKIGDLNMDVIPQQDEELALRNGAPTFALTVEDIELQPGTTYVLDFNSTDLPITSGFQFTLRLNPEVANIVGIEGGAAGVESFGTNRLSDGIITSSWNQLDGLPYQENDRLVFRLIIESNGYSRLSEIMQLASGLTRAEAYGLEGNIKPLAISFMATGATDSTFDLLQNRPNPFKEETIIGFSLPSMSKARLSIYDQYGRLLKEVNQVFPRGYNEIPIRAEELQSGVLFYLLETEDQRLSRRMLLIQ
ncbi:MAG: hypothetical protein DHS20C18_29900 [Saprospiraceae bacterium]|nr:MAG: hypothetical protein DHS20C18_29900 [Saprospiraceae bacterium]